MRPHTFWNRTVCIPVALAICVIMHTDAVAQDALTYRGDQVPAEVESIYTKGLAWLVRNQTAGGCWDGTYGTEPGVVGAAVLAMLAHGDDPNFGSLREPIRKALDYILSQANDENGYIGSSMYNHGFATLALAEAYGTVNDPRLGPALRKAVNFILACQARNSMGAWRYTPDSTDADTTVSGAQVVALLAAQNAGIAVPDKAIQTALAFFSQTQSGNGGFGYTGGGGHGGATPTAIGTLVFALARQKSAMAFKSGLRSLQHAGDSSMGHEFYHLYYLSQALFHGNMEKWEKWNLTNSGGLALSQGSDGGWTAPEGEAFATSAALLSLALNYRYLPIYER
jgi:squalene cyclase